MFFCRDVETACDEKVIAHMDLTDRRLYSAALLACSTGGRMLFCPVAFGEVGVKERIKHIMKYTKPAFLRNLPSVVLCIGLMVCVFALPVGCAEATASGGPAVYEPVDTGAADYEGTDRIVNEDGSVTMLFMPESDFSSDSIQTFRYAGEGSTVTAEPTDGFITTSNEDGRIIYLSPDDFPADTEMTSGAYLTSTDEEGYINYTDLGPSVSADAGADIVWIPREINFDDNDGKSDSVIIFTVSNGDTTVDTVTITISTDEYAVTPDGITALNIFVDDEHTLSVDGRDINRTIIIEEAG